MHLKIKKSIKPTSSVHKLFFYFKFAFFICNCSIIMNSYVLYSNESEMYFILENTFDNSEMKISKSVNNIDKVINGFKDANITVKETKKECKRTLFFCLANRTIAYMGENIGGD